MNKNAKVSCVVFWEGFPACGHMLKDLNTRLGSSLQVIATIPAAPFSELGKFLENEIIYLTSVDQVRNYFHMISVADVFIHTGWSHSVINDIDKKLVSTKSGVKKYVLVDNRLKFTLRQFLGAIYFRIFLNKIYDGFIVSGKSSYNLMRFFGVPPNKISSGHYGASSDLYPRWSDSFSKSNEVTFIGSLDKRKGADILLKGWSEYKNQGGKMTLNLIGSGEYQDYFKGIDGVNVFGFLQPDESSKILLRSLVFVLPGRDDNWATVIAEAAASGCILLSTKFVGATYDLLEEGRNGYLLDVNSSNSLPDKLMQIQKTSPESLVEMANASVEKSLKFDSPRLTQAVQSLFGQSL